MSRNSQSTIPRYAGAGLAVYGVGTAIAFLGSGTPGGSYRPADVGGYLASGHAMTAFGLWYLGALSALALLVVAAGLHRLPGTGPVLAGLAVTGAAVSVTGAFVAGGLAVAGAEGGDTVREGLSGPVGYTIGEIGNLLAVCGPALCVGVLALLLAARGPLAAWLRACSVVAGVCGILAPLFFPYFVFVLWTVVAGVALSRGSRRRDLSEPRPSLV